MRTTMILIFAMVLVSDCSGWYLPRRTTKKPSEIVIQDERWLFQQFQRPRKAANPPPIMNNQRLPPGEIDFIKNAFEQFSKPRELRRPNHRAP